MAYTLRTDKSWHETQFDLSETMRTWGVAEWKTNRPRGAQRWSDSQTEQVRTVRLTYVKNGKEVNLTMDTQKRAVDNLRVLYLAVEAMRLNEARGIADVVESAYLQLAAHSTDVIPTRCWASGLMPRLRWQKQLGKP